MNNLERSQAFGFEQAKATYQVTFASLKIKYRTCESLYKALML